VAELRNDGVDLSLGAVLLPTAVPIEPHMRDSAGVAHGERQVVVAGVRARTYPAEPAARMPADGSDAARGVPHINDGRICLSRKPTRPWRVGQPPGSKLYFRQPNASVIYVWTPRAHPEPFAGHAGSSSAGYVRRADAGDDYLAFTVRDSGGIPHVSRLYGTAGRQEEQLPNERLTPSFLTRPRCPGGETVRSSCASAPSTQPDGKTFTYSIVTRRRLPRQYLRLGACLAGQIYLVVRLPAP